MGYRCRWIASRAAPGAVLAELQLSKSGQSTEPVYDPGLYGLALPAGWYVVIGDGWDSMDLLEEAQARALSRTGEALFFYTDDTPMCSRLAAYQDGTVTWAVTYDGADGVGAPELEGEVPRAAAAVLDRLKREQEKAGGQGAEVDHLYELTTEVARTLIGFRHDQSLAEGEHAPIDLLALAP